MKLIRIISVLIFTLLITWNVVAQEEDSLNFFPLHEGDLWQYLQVPNNLRWEVKVVEVDTVEADSSIEVTTITGISWEIKYKIYFNDKHTIYWDIDTGWSVAFKFNVPVGSFWLNQPSLPSWTMYKSKFRDYYYIFEDSIDAREYWNAPDTNFILATSVYRLARGFGRYFAEGEFSNTFLTGCIINGIQYGTLVDIEEGPDVIIPQKIELKSYPNPFNSQTNIVYSLPSESNVTIKIYNALGEEVELLYSGVKGTGEHLQVWNAHNKSSGIYFYRITSGNFTESKKLILLK